jgi:hypothetical protein
MGHIEVSVWPCSWLKHVAAYLNNIIKFVVLMLINPLKMKPICFI